MRDKLQKLIDARNQINGLYPLTNALVTAEMLDGVNSLNRAIGMLKAELDAQSGQGKEHLKTPGGLWL